MPATAAKKKKQLKSPLYRFDEGTYRLRQNYHDTSPPKRKTNVSKKLVLDTSSFRNITSYCGGWGYRSPITDYRSPITDHRSPISNHRSPTVLLQASLGYALLVFLSLNVMYFMVFIIVSNALIFCIVKSKAFFNFQLDTFSKVDFFF